MGTAEEPTAAKAAAFSGSLSRRKPTLEGEELRWNNGFQRSDSSGRCHGEDLVASCHSVGGVSGEHGEPPQFWESLQQDWDTEAATLLPLVMLLPDIGGGTGGRSLK